MAYSKYLDGWTKERDEMVMTVSDNHRLAEIFGCTPRAVSDRRFRLKQIQEKRDKFKATFNIKSVTARPSFFVEDLNRLMKGNPR